MNSSQGSPEPQITSATDNWRFTRIARDGIYIDGVKLPGYIEEDGVTLRPVRGARINRLTREPSLSDQFRSMGSARGVAHNYSSLAIIVYTA